MAQYDNKEREYKANVPLTRPATQPQSQVEVEVEHMRHELAENLERFKDPVFLGMLMKKVADERENSNRILKNIFARLDAMESRLRMLELAQSKNSDAQMAMGVKETAAKPSAPRPPILLPDVDYEIAEFARQKTRVCAEEVQKRFKYRGTNAACARLNRLFEQGILEKKQVGRKVYYLPTGAEVQKA